MIIFKTKLCIAIAFCGLTWASWSQETHPNYNFENFEGEQPVGWSLNSVSAFTAIQDFEVYKEGKSSLRITIPATDQINPMTMITKVLPNYKGKKLVLSGYIKTKGDATLKLTPSIEVKPMLKYVKLPELITGSTEWTKYEVEVDLLPRQTQQIVVATQVMGSGTVWLDDFKVTIDGQDVADAEVFEIKYPAQEDKTFDTGSAVVFPTLDGRQIDNLALLGKVWGFLKYHHPAIAQGNYNWDYELFRFLPDYLQVTSETQRDALLVQWIEQLGMVKLCETCEETSKTALLKPNLNWMETYSLSNELQSKISYIYANRTQGDHYYVTGSPKIGNAVFTNELSYEQMEYPDAGFRLLALYRFWNVMQYYMPNRHITDKDWETVLATHIQSFIEAENRLAYEIATVQLIAEVNDTHSDLWEGNKELQKLRGNNYAPFRVEFIEDQLVVTEIYNPELLENLKIEPGDRITHLNQRSIAQILDSISPYHPASNRSVQLRDISLFNILRTKENQVVIAYLTKDNQEKKGIVPMFPKSKLNSYGWFKTVAGEPGYRFLEEGIGYITLGNIQDKDVEVIKSKFRDTKGIVIDIRNYPSAFIPFTLGGYFVDTPTPFVKFSQPNYNNPGEIVFGENLLIKPDDKPYEGKVIVLVDARTQSAAEYATMAFQAGKKVTVIGSQTAGADGNASQVVLPGGLGTFISGLGVYYPDGKETQRIGIVPDIEVKRTIQGVREQRDELVEKAIELIKQ